MDFELEQKHHKLEDWTLDLIIRSQKEIEALENENNKLKEEIKLLKTMLDENK